MDSTNDDRRHNRRHMDTRRALDHRINCIVDTDPVINENDQMTRIDDPYRICRENNWPVEITQRYGHYIAAIRYCSTQDMLGRGATQKDALSDALESIWPYSRNQQDQEP